MSPAEAPSRVAQYRILRKLGEGGMGVVYAAHDERLERPVAIKMIRRDAADSRARERMWREARSAASVNHPNVCQLYEIGEEEGELFISMELLEGESLAARVGRGSMPLEEVGRVGLGVLDALEALHGRGFVHRDLKPSNVFLTPHGVKLLDFGLARPLDAPGEGDTGGLTLPGTVIGTPRYLAPEQVRGDGVDGRSDLFAMGAILFEMLSGRPAFDGAAIVHILHAVLEDQPPPLRGSSAIEAVDRVIARALAKEPARRFPTAAEMSEALRGALAIETPSGETARVHSATRMIALPFRILRADPETDFLAFSLPDAITSSLSGLESLIVRSSLAAARFADGPLDLEAIASKASVDVVLTGTLLRAGDQVRVSTQLLQAPEGTVLWTHTAQYPLGDLFQLQDHLTDRIVESLEVPLTARERRQLKHDVPGNAKAYEYYLRANPLSQEPAQWTVARDLYRKCLELDPRYAPAWARLGRLERVIGVYSGEAPESYQARSDDAFRRALEIHPELTLAHNLYTNLEVELGRCKEAMLRLLAIAGNGTGDAEIYAGLVQACRYCGLGEAAVAAYEHAVRLDPEVRTSVAYAYTMVGNPQRAVETDRDNPPFIKSVALALLGRPAEAAAMMRETLAARPTKLVRLWTEAMMLHLEGDDEGARAACRELLRMRPPFDPCSRYYLARVPAALGMVEEGLALLRQSVEGGFHGPTLLAQDPCLDPIRGEPEFAAIAAEAERRCEAARVAFEAAGGRRVLGLA